MRTFCAAPLRRHHAPSGILYQKTGCPAGCSAVSRHCRSSSAGSLRNRGSGEVSAAERLETLFPDMGLLLPDYGASRSPAASRMDLRTDRQRRISARSFQLGKPVGLLPSVLFKELGRYSDPVSPGCGSLRKEKPKASLRRIPDLVRRRNYFLYAEHL